AISGNGWTCGTNSCTRNDALAGGASYPVIAVAVNVAATAATPLSNSATVSGGGSASATATDWTIVIQLPVLAISSTHTGSFTQGQNGTYSVTVSNQAGAGTTSGTV